MKPFATPEPDSDPALQRLIVQARAQHGGPLRLRASYRDFLAAFTFLIAAVAIGAGLDTGKEFDPVLAAGLVGAYIFASRVEFRVGFGVADPSELVFVPMLFLLPASSVPLVVMLALLGSRLPEYISGAVHPTRAVLRIADNWHTIGPALVLSIAGVTAPDWQDWPIYLAALASQYAADFVSSVVREPGRVNITPASLWDEFRAVYLVDTALAPIGLLAAFAASSNEWAFVLVVPTVVLFAVFAREREARIENALTLSSAYRGTAHLLGELLSTTHEYTGHHSRSVVVLAHQVGEELGLDERTLREIEFGALLHDVGKMAVPNEIINKPGVLTDEEWDVMKRHTVEGYEMLEKIGGVLAEAGAVVRSHHERFDGTGYPDGLAGDAIPIAARVVTACDSFNAMTTNRPYRAAMSMAEAIDELRAHSGRQFDPNVVEALVRVVEGWEVPDHAPESSSFAVR